MSVESLLTYALTCIGMLLSMLITLVVYIVISLKNEILGVKDDIADLTGNHAKFIHKDDCRQTSNRIHERLDEQEAILNDLGQRMTKVETKLELRSKS